MELTGALWILVVSSVRIFSVHGADNIAIDRPGSAVWLPIQCVCGELLGHVESYLWLCTSVKITSDALAEVVGLNSALRISKVVT